MDSVETLRNIGQGKEALIFATGHSYKDFDYKLIDPAFIVFEINKMRIPIKVDYSIYYDVCWEHYFNENGIKDNRKLIGFRLHPTNESNRLSKYCSYWYDLKLIPFSDTGFHCLYIASEIMKFKIIYLIGYDYYKVNGKWHPYEDDYLTEDEKVRKEQILENQINKYSEVSWQAEIYNYNVKSALTLFNPGLPYNFN